MTHVLDVHRVPPFQSKRDQRSRLVPSTTPSPSCSPPGNIPQTSLDRLGVTLERGLSPSNNAALGLNPDEEPSGSDIEVLDGFDKVRVGTLGGEAGVRGSGLVSLDTLLVLDSELRGGEIRGLLLRELGGSGGGADGLRGVGGHGGDEWDLGVCVGGGEKGEGMGPDGAVL